MGDEDWNEIGNTRGYEKSAVQLASFSLADLILVLLQDGLVLVLAILGMVD